LAKKAQSAKIIPNSLFISVDSIAATFSPLIFVSISHSTRTDTTCRRHTQASTHRVQWV